MVGCAWGDVRREGSGSKSGRIGGEQQEKQKQSETGGLGRGGDCYSRRGRGAGGRS